jgi:hypothetical protein
MEMRRSELQDHIGQRANALKEHERLLAAEVLKGGKQTAFHTFSRHGHQTGWLAQLVRLMTGEAPDQPFALNGVRAAIMEWEKRSGGQGEHPAPTRNIRYAPADSVGCFLGPEMETEAIHFATQRTLELQKVKFAEMETRKSGTSVRKWEPFKYIEIVTDTRFRYCGVSFVLKDKNRRRTREEFEEALHDYLSGGLGLRGTDVSLWDEMMLKEAKAKGTAIHPTVAAKMKIRFPNLSDLLDYLRVEAVMMPNIRLVLKRIPDNSFDWKLHTAYAVNTPCQLRPDAPGTWTGRVKQEAHSQPRLLSKVV